VVVVIEGVDRAIAAAGAEAEGPLRSSRTGIEAAASPSIANVRRRGVEKAAAWA